MDHKSDMPIGDFDLERAGKDNNANRVEEMVQERDAARAELAQLKRRLSSAGKDDASDCEKCHRCGRRYLTCYGVPDHLWEIVSGKEDGSGLLCPQCFDEVARKKKIILFWSADNIEQRDELKDESVSGMSRREIKREDGSVETIELPIGAVEMLEHAVRGIHVERLIFLGLLEVGKTGYPVITDKGSKWLDTDEDPAKLTFNAEKDSTKRLD